MRKLLSSITVAVLILGASSLFAAEVPETGTSFCVEISSREFLSFGVYDIDKESTLGGWARIGVNTHDNDIFAYGFGVNTQIWRNFFGYAGPVFEVRPNNFDGSLAIGVLFSAPMKNNVADQGWRLLLNLGYDDLVGTTFGLGGQF